MTYQRSGIYGPGLAGRSALNDVRWGAVTSGTFVGLGFMTLLSSLWVALGYAAGIGFISDNIQWWLAGTGVAAFFVAGLVAGYSSGVRGARAGLLNSATVWGLISTVGIAVAVGIGFATLNLNNGGLSNLHTQVSDNALWATFGGIAVGLFACVLGGILGGLAMRPIVYAPVEQRVDDRVGDRVDGRGDARVAYPEDRTAVVDRDEHRDHDYVDAVDEPGRHRRP